MTALRKAMEPIRIYLACPYSHKDPEVQERRYDIATRKAADLMFAGHIVFSPITHSHPISHHLPEMGHDFWMRQDFAFLDWADELWVCGIDGFRESEGVNAEIDYALKHKMTVKILP